MRKERKSDGQGFLQEGDETPTTDLAAQAEMRASWQCGVVGRQGWTALDPCLADSLNGRVKLQMSKKDLGQTIGC